MIINLSLPRRRESSKYKRFWIPAFAGTTFLEVAISLGSDGPYNTNAVARGMKKRAKSVLSRTVMEAFSG